MRDGVPGPQALDRSGWATAARVMCGSAIGFCLVFLFLIHSAAREGGYTLSVLLPTGPQPYHIAAGDLNGNGQLDLVVSCRGELQSPELERPANDTITVYLSQEGGAGWERADFPVGFGPYTAAIADLDSDGAPDVVVANFQANDGRHLAVLYGARDRPGTFEPTRYVAIDGDDFVNEKGVSRSGAMVYPAPGPTSVAAADFNGDGRPDIVAVAWTSDFFVVLLNQGGRTFTQHRYPMLPGPRDVVVADFDGDGIDDLAFSLYSSNLVEVWTGDGKGGFELWRRAHSFGERPYHLRAADLDGDGRLDLVVGNRGTSDNVVVLRNEPHRFSYAGSFSPGTQRTGETTADSIRDLYLADLDGDGKLDLIAACHLSHKVVLWKGTGDLAFGKAFTDRTVLEFPGKGPRALSVLGSTISVAFFDSDELGLLTRSP